MDGVAKLPPSNRQAIFEVAGADLGVLPQVIEKDFWVTWTLKRLFSIPALQGHIVFKGGTSLSKAFGLIQRFSEDVDLTLDRDLLGLPDFSRLQKMSRNERKDNAIPAMRKKLENYVRTTLIDLLTASIAAELGPSAPLALDSEGNDELLLMFEYPRTAITPAAQSGYMNPSIKLELGVRGSDSPRSARTIQPLAYSAAPAQFKAPFIDVDTLDAERTFWEKVLILHDGAVSGTLRKPALFRHYYDVAQISRSPIGASALARKDLLAAVVEHAELFWNRAISKRAALSAIRLVPDDGVLGMLRDDHARMASFFFGTAPVFDEIIETLRALEAELHALV